MGLEGYGLFIVASVYLTWPWRNENENLYSESKQL